MTGSMECPSCAKAVLERKKVPFVYGSKFLGEFDADTCPSCGEVLFTEEASGEINRRAAEVGVWGIPPTTPTFLDLGGRLTKSLDLLRGIQLGGVDDNTITTGAGASPFALRITTTTAAAATLA